MANRIIWFVTVFLVTLTVTLAAPTENNEVTKCTTETTCSSDSCKRTTEEVLKMIDTSVEPCDDFYNFACGGYLKNNEIPSDQVQISQIGDITNHVSDQLHDLVVEPIKDTDPKTLKLVKNLFQTCMDTETRNKHGLTPAKELLKKIGGWPVVEGDEWKEESHGTRKLMYKLRKFGLDTSTFISTTIVPHAKDSTKRIIALAQVELPIPSLEISQGFNSKIVRAYHKYLVDLAGFFGANKDTATVEFKTMIEFAMELQKILIPPEDLRDLSASTNIMTVTELQKRFPYLNWVEYLNNMFAISDIEVTEETLVDVGMPKYFTDLEGLLKKTPKRVLANYAVSIAIVGIANTLPSEVTDRTDEYIKEALGTTSVADKWKDCIRVVTTKLKIATAAVYARKYFSQDAKDNIKQLVSRLHNKFLSMLEKVDWMDDATRNSALEKAKAIEEHVAYPKELLDDKLLDDYYATLDVSNNYMQFQLNIVKFTQDHMFKSFAEPLNRNDWKEHSVSHEVNAYYHVSENSIIIPAGILQGAEFKSDRPDYMNFGGIGFIVGHELTHGFDDKGKQVSKDGQLHNWWSKETERAYLDKANCILYHYGNYTNKKLDASLNSPITLGENIADNGGFKLVYEAYQETVRSKGLEKCLPNLNYTPNQMLWISFANGWCTKTRDEQLKTEMLSSDHSPAMYRVYGVVENSQYFAKDFNCPANTK